MFSVHHYDYHYCHHYIVSWQMAGCRLHCHLHLNFHLFIQDPTHTRSSRLLNFNLLLYFNCSLKNCFELSICPQYMSNSGFYTCLYNHQKCSNLLEFFEQLPLYCLPYPSLLFLTFISRSVFPDPWS